MRHIVRQYFFVDFKVIVIALQKKINFPSNIEWGSLSYHELEPRYIEFRKSYCPKNRTEIK